MAQTQTGIGQIAKVSIMGKHGLKVVDLNRRKAIRERCLNCSCWITSEVTNCSFSDCPLYPFRSGRGKQNPKARGMAIKKYCLWCMCRKQSEVRRCVSTDCPLYAYRMKAIDRSVEINSEAQNGHIEPLFETKTNNKGIVQYL